MSKENNKKSYSKFTYDDLQALGIETEVKELFPESIPPIEPSAWLLETLEKGSAFSLNTEKAKSEFIIAPILNELYQNNKTVFAVYSGFNFDVDKKRGLQGFCDFLLARLPLNVVPRSPIIAVVEAKQNDVITAAVPQCASEMYAAKIWNEKHGKPTQIVFGAITTGNNWLFLRYDEAGRIEVDKNIYQLSQLSELLGVWQHIIDKFK